MLTVKQLIELNHQMRSELLLAWQFHKSGPDDGKFLPLLHFALQAMKKHEAMELLIQHNLGQEAGMMLRSIFEAMVNAIWIAQDLENRLKRFHAYQFFSAQKYQKLGQKLYGVSKTEESAAEDEAEQSLRQKAEEEGWRDLPHWIFKNGVYWSGKSLYNMAVEIGMEKGYDTVYRVYSEVVHVSVASGSEYFSQGDDGVTTIRRKTVLPHGELCLRQSYYFMLLIFSALEECVGIQLKQVLDKYQMLLPKVMETDA